MKYPDWAPAPVVEMHSELCESRDHFRSQDHDKEDLESYAKSDGYACWADFEKSLTLQIAVLDRLLTRPEMKSVWEWISEKKCSLPLEARGGIVGRFLMDIQKWDTSSKASATGRDAEFKEIVNHAKNLSRLLRKYSGEMGPNFNHYTALIPKKYDQILKSYLREDLLELIEREPLMLRGLWRQFLPPIEEIIGDIARSIDEGDSKSPREFPRKIASPTAFRTYLIYGVIDRFYGQTGEIPLTIIATFLSVALDDASIAVDTINKSEAMQKIKREKILGKYR